MDRNIGFSEAVLILLALGGFAVQPNPHAPAAAEVLRYAPADADAMMHVDLEGVLPKNYRTFQHLPQDRAIRALPKDAQRDIAQAVREAEAGRVEARQKLGFDPIDDVKSATAFVSLRDKGEPEVLIVARGKFSANTLDRLDDTIGAVPTEAAAGAASVHITHDGKTAFAMVAPGTLVAGSVAWVRARAHPDWKPAARGGVGELVRAQLDEKPMVFVASRPSPAALRLYKRELSDRDAAWARDFMTGHELATLSLFWNGMGWSYAARTPAGYARAVMATDGIIELMRAGHLGVRGTARVFLAAADSFTADPEIAQIVAHKAELLRILETWTGDGNFAARVARKPGERRVSVRLQGKSLSDVVPVAAIAFAVGIGGALAWH